MPPLNLALPTLGGRQFWGDVRFEHGWRIQQHVYTGHYRLLDPRDIRRGWGSLATCEQRLDEFRRSRSLPPLSGRAVILIHGLFRSSKAFGRLKNRLQATGSTVIGFDYPSSRVPLCRSAEYLRQVISSLEGITEIDFVVHSLGGLLVRTFLKECGTQIDPRCRRMVMIGVPNRGARMATHLRRVLLFRWIYGPAGQELVEGAEEFVESLPVPPFEFAVIAGGRGTAGGWNPFIPGDDDGTISVDCTRLPGASDFLIVRTMHTSLVFHPEIVEATCRFLETGALRKTGLREPIPMS